MECTEKLKLENKSTGFTVIEIIVVMAIIALLLIIAIPGLAKYVKIANHTAEIGIADSIYKSSMSAVTQEFINVQSQKTNLHNSPNVIYKLNENTPIVQDILSGVSKNVVIDVYSYTALELPKDIIESNTESWVVFVKSANGRIDTTGDIYILAPTTKNWYSNGDFMFALNN